MVTKKAPSKKRSPPKKKAAAKSAKASLIAPSPGEASEYGFNERSADIHKALAAREERHDIFVSTYKSLRDKGYTARDIVRILNLLPSGSKITSSMQSKLVEMVGSERTNSTPTRKATKTGILAIQLLDLLHDRKINLNKIDFDDEGQLIISKQGSKST